MSGRSHAPCITAALERPADTTAGVAVVRERAGSLGARRAFGDLRVTAGGSSLVVGKPDDAFEIEADPRFFANNRGDLVDQMRRQAQFAKDWKFSRYEWDMYSDKDVIAAKNIRKQLPPDLAAWIEITEIK